MPPPFPGMDPYIESPMLWSDFHNDLASEIRAQLNRDMQSVYERGADAQQIDYTQPPPPPARSEAETAWVQTLLGQSAPDDPQA